jgi:LytS/YehU family sensor histidine kinase
VGSLIYKGEKDSAYLYLKGLTDLLRMVSGDASQVTWSLSDELGFVEKYLDIEKLRFGEKFEFTLDVEDEPLNDQQVPKMSILTFVENAIKHGLRHKEGNWMLSISVTRTRPGLKIMIRDNGIGRAAALKYRDESTGTGIEMMEAYFRQFSEVTGKQANFSVTDLFETDRKASGTRVEISITK